MLLDLVAVSVLVTTAAGVALYVLAQLHTDDDDDEWVPFEELREEDE